MVLLWVRAFLVLVLVKLSNAEGPTENDVSQVYIALIRAIRKDGLTVEQMMHREECYAEVPDCMPSVAPKAFIADVRKGIAKTMKKRDLSMRLGLKTIGGAISNLTELCASACEESAPESRVLRVIAMQFERICSFEENIKYEPKKSLRVGGFDVYSAFNKVISAWKANPVDPSAFGQALGELIVQYKTRDLDDAYTGVVNLALQQSRHAKAAEL